MRSIKSIALIVAVIGLLTAVVVFLTESIKLAREIQPQLFQQPESVPPEPNSIPTEPYSSYSFPNNSNNPPVEFFNEWANIDPQSKTIKQVSIQAKDGSTYINMFGSCSPTDCNFREYSPSPVVNYTYDSETKILHVEWILDFEIMTQEITMTSDGQLRVQTFNHFIDNSGRLDFEMTDYFVRQ